jgi:UDP-2,3-diacylglucosamine hydrolase
MVRAPHWQQRFLALSVRDRELLAGEARAGSQRHTSHTIPYIMDVNREAVTAAYRATRVRRIVHGHTHRPGIHDESLDGVPVQRIVLGAWYEQGSYLEYDNGRFALHALS